MTVSYKSIAPPKIHTHPMGRTVMIDNDTTSVTFTCMANGASSYFWQRENGNISSDAEGINTSTLTLKNILPSDNGRYYCVAENEHGRSNSNYALLTVEGNHQLSLHNNYLLHTFNSSSSCGNCHAYRNKGE